MEYFLQQLINGIMLGSIYGLVAIGYTMVYGIIGMINFAHGDIFMVGAFLALIAFLRLVAIGVTAVPLALFLVLIVAMALDGALRLGGGTPRLPAAARLVPAGAADLRHRHVDHPAELRADRAGRPRQAAAAADPRRLHADREQGGFAVQISNMQIIIVVTTLVADGRILLAGCRDTHSGATCAPASRI